MYKPTQTCTRKQVDLGFKLHKTPFFPFAEVAEVLQSSVDNREDRCGWSAAQDVKNSSLKLCSGTDYNVALSLLCWGEDWRQVPRLVSHPTFIKEDLFSSRKLHRSLALRILMVPKCLSLRLGLEFKGPRHIKVSSQERDAPISCALPPSST